MKNEGEIFVYANSGFKIMCSILGDNFRLHKFKSQNYSSKWGDNLCLHKFSLKIICSKLDDNFFLVHWKLKNIPSSEEKNLCLHIFKSQNYWLKWGDNLCLQKLKLQNYISKEVTILVNTHLNLKIIYSNRGGRGGEGNLCLHIKKYSFKWWKKLHICKS